MNKITCSAKNINKSFGTTKILHDVSINLKEGEIFGLLGSNGAGKSTLTKIMTGLMNQDSGQIIYFGNDLNQNYNELKSILGVVPQEISCYHGFTVKENLRFFGLMYNLKNKELEEKTNYLLKWLSLSKFSNKTVNKLSGGYKRLTNIACSLINDPQIIFMDEPTVGLDPKLRHLLWEKIRELKSIGKTICLTTHYLDEAQALCDRVGLLTEGKMLVEGKPIELIKKYGGYRIVIINVSSVLKSEDVEVIKNSFENSQIEIIGNAIIISFNQKGSLKKISTLTQWLQEKKYDILNSTIREPELEDVFLNLTGERMRK